MITNIRCSDYSDERTHHFGKYKPVSYQEACDIGVWKEVNQNSSDFHLAVTGIITPSPVGLVQDAGFWLNAENKIIGFYSDLLQGGQGYDIGKPNFHFTCGMERASNRMILLANYGRIQYLSLSWVDAGQRLLDFISSDKKIPAVHKIQKWWLQIKYNPNLYAGKKCFYQGGITKELWSKEQVPIRYWTREQLQEAK